MLANARELSCQWFRILTNSQTLCHSMGATEKPSCWKGKEGWKCWRVGMTGELEGLESWKDWSLGCANFPKMFEKNGEIVKLKKRGYYGVHFWYIKLYPKGFWPETSFWGLSLLFSFWKTVWFLLWLCKIVLVNNLPQKRQTSKSWFIVSLGFHMHFYATIKSAIQRNNQFRLKFTVFITYFWKTT